MKTDRKDKNPTCTEILDNSMPISHLGRFNHPEPNASDLSPFHFRDFSGRVEFSPKERIGIQADAARSNLR